MYGLLSHLTESELLTLVQLILARPGNITLYDRTELDQINTELVRRQRVAVLRDCLRNPETFGLDMCPEPEL